MNNEEHNTAQTIKPSPDVFTPWHKSPWPFFFFGFPAIAVVAGLATLIIAMNSPAKVISVVTGDVKKEGFRNMAAIERGLSVVLFWNENDQLVAKLSTADVPTAQKTNRITVMPDKVISVHLFVPTVNANNSNKPMAVVDEKNKSIATRTSGGVSILALDLILDTNGEFVSTQKLPPSLQQRDYWVEVIGDKAAWSLSGHMQAGQINKFSAGTSEDNAVTQKP